MSDFALARTRPPVGGRLWPAELRLTIRTSEEGSSAVLSSFGRRSLVSRAWPRWLVPNWIS